MKLDFAEPATLLLSFFVPGLPAPGGSKRFVGMGKKTGRAILIDAAGVRNKNWRTCVACCGHEHAPAELLRGALSVSFAFVMPRPKSHYHTSKKRAGALREDAPTFHTSTPDVLKLSRSTEDALTNVIWADDAQTVRLTATKEYGDKPGCQITITAL
jgi:Holliday junction resolvase RusA-like endonuclease